jgi:WD40 repeat protein
MPRVKPSVFTFTPTSRYQLSDYVTDIAWSPHTDQFAAVSAGGDVLLGDSTEADFSEVLAIAPNPPLSRVAFAARAPYLAAVGQAGTVLLWHLASTASPTRCDLPFPAAKYWLDTLAWHPVQPYLAYGLGEQVMIWDVAQSTHLATLDFQDSSVLHLDWHPAGDRLAVSGHGGVKVWSAADWSAPPTLIKVPGASLHCRWSADGRYLGSGNLDRTLTVMEWGSPPPWLMQGFPGKVRQVEWSKPMKKDSPPIVATACAEGITVWERQSQGEGWASRVLQHHAQRVNAIAFHPQQLYLASAGQDGRIALWRQGKKLDQTLDRFAAAVTRIVWSSRGDRLMAASSTGELQIWSVAKSAQGFG